MVSQDKSMEAMIQNDEERNGCSLCSISVMTWMLTIVIAETFARIGGNVQLFERNVDGEIR